MPTRKKSIEKGRFKIGKPERPELILLSLPLLCLGLVLLAAVLTSNAASSKAPVAAQVPTPSPVSAARVTPSVTTAAATIPAPTTTAAPTTASVAPATASVATPVPAASPTTPAQTIKLGSPAGTGMRLSKTEGGLKFDMLVSPGHMGDNSYEVALSENGNLAVSDASLVRLSVTSLDMEMGVARLDLTPAGPDEPGLYSGQDHKLQMLSMVGKFKIEVLVQRPGKSDVTTSFDVNVTNGS